MKYKNYSIAILFVTSSLAHAIKLPFDFFQDKLTEQATRVQTTPIADQINVLESDLEQLAKTITEKGFSEQLKNINQATEEIKKKLEPEPSNEFLMASLTIHNKMYQTILETEQAYKDIQSIVEQHSKFLKEYREDSQFTKLRIEPKTYYTFDELQKVGHQLQDYEGRLASIQEKSKTLNTELVSRKKKLSVVETELKKKQKQREDIAQGVDIEVSSAMSTKEQGEILDLQIKLLELRMDAAQAKVIESERRIAFADSQRFILQDQVRLLKNEYSRVKSGVRVDNEYVQEAQEDLDKKRAESLRKVKRFAENIRAINDLQEELEEELASLSEKYLIPVDTLPLSDWVDRTDISTNQWIGNAQIMRAYEEIATYETSKELIQAQSDQEEIKFKSQEILFEIIESWHKMSILKNAIDTDEELRAEIKKYDGPKAELQADLASVNERLSNATNLLSTLHNALEDVKLKRQKLKKQKDSLFQGKENEFELAAQALNEMEETFRARIDATAKLIEIYSAQQSLISNALKEIEHTVKELNLKDFWQPSAQAIDWAAEMDRIIPDIRLFFSDLRSLSSSYSPQSLATVFAKKIKSLTQNYWQLLLLIINLILIIVVFFLLRIYLMEGREALFRTSQIPKGKYRASLFFGFLFSFIQRYLIFIYPWIVTWLLIQFNIFYDVYFIIIFYLVSIPLYIFLFNRFFSEFSVFNRMHEFLFLNERYERRFNLVVSWLSYALSCILFFRLAFMLLNYHQSNLPTVLLAIAVILCQIAAILLIGREQILRLIPGKTEIGQWLKQFIDQYYYIIVVVLFGVIVMSNPYVGFFRQVSYIVSRLLITAVAIPLFLRLHNFLKHRSSALFFYTEGETLKERFPYAKAAYGLMVIATFLGFVVISILVLSRVWDYPIRFKDISSLLQEDIMPSPGIDAQGNPIHITIMSLFQVIGYTVFGMLLVFFINRMVLGRLFDLLLVNVGVQNTLFTLVRYVIIAIAFLIGLASVHLDYLVTYIGAALVALGFALKEPVSDVICYFVIIVQRPIKIGDFIMLDEELSGVVRQITPRSVILRKKNSVTLVVPNSQIVTRPIINWNYTPTYFAFSDISLTVAYTADPKKVRELIIKVLEEYPSILKSPAPVVRLKNFTENGYEFMVRGYLSADKTLDQWDIQSDVRLKIVEILRKNNVEIAVPARVLKIISGQKFPTKFPDTEEPEPTDD